uniref:GTPase Era, mitochondrial n=1 Tax=Timema cristinae TaxID=61476 RepID=A0A7R9DEM7_TIMCR|nr:unnamed protein product [Timema cristinae]
MFSSVHRSHNLIRSESRQTSQTITSFRNVSTSSIYQEEYETYVVHNETLPENPHLVKVAIIGLPNAGKSTLINSLTGRKACPISSKVHTTRCRARAILVRDNTQIVFLDTPGLVTEEESKNHHLEPQYIRDGEKALKEAHVIGVVHDASNYWLKHRLDEKVLRLLHLYPHKDSFLILNKIDILKSKRNLLDLVKVLTNGSLVGQQPPEPGGSKKPNYLSESQVKKAVKPERGWPNFREVFLVSALTRSGVDGVEKFLLKSSRPGPWMFSGEQFSDQSPEWLIEETVRGRLLEHLPQEIPYNLNTRIEYFHRGEQGNLVSVVLVECATPRLQKLVVGSKGSRIRTIAMEAEQDLYHTFQQPVMLKLIVQPFSRDDGMSSGTQEKQSKGLVEPLARILLVLLVEHDADNDARYHCQSPHQHQQEDLDAGQGRWFRVFDMICGYDEQHFISFLRSTIGVASNGYDENSHVKTMEEEKRKEVQRRMEERGENRVMVVGRKETFKTDSTSGWKLFIMIIIIIII